MRMMLLMSVATAALLMLWAGALMAPENRT
jgi:hypothetical protein